MQKCITVGVNLPDTDNIEYQLNELTLLCEACEIECQSTIIQNLPKFNPATYIGKGKIDEIKMLLSSLDIDLVVFNDELTPSQIDNLQKELNSLIFDRTYIILEIFKRRAKTKEAILQVELASLKYLLPRLAGMRKGLSRQGNSGSGAHNKGSGETQLELDRRLTSDKISFIKQQLNALTLVRQTQRKSRKENNEKIVSLVGYTNSGKSSTLNALLNYSTGIKKTVFQKDMLFATLETYTRCIHLTNNHSFLITDTVGFVEKLPHHLVEAFKSTLEEIKESDLILHVVDCTNQNFQEQIDVTNKVLDSLGVQDIPTIYVFNKIDQIEDYFYIPNEYANSVRISALNNTNLDNLLSMIEKQLFKDREIKIKIPYDKSIIISDIKTSGTISNIEYLSDGIIINASVSQLIYDKLANYLL